MLVDQARFRFVDAGRPETPSSQERSGQPGPVDSLAKRMDRGSNAWGGADEVLTGRQRECLALAAEGKTTPEIAIILGLSAHTVGHHLNEAQARLDAVNRVQAVAMAIRRGII